MSEGGQQIGRDAVDLLLQIMEMPRPVVTAAAIDALGPHRATPLIKAGLLKPDGHERTSVSMSDHDDAPVALAWSADHGGYGYFSPTAGWTSVSDDEIARYAVDLPVFFTSLMRNADVSSRGGPTPLLPELLWEIGDVRLGRRPQRIPVWFARRLHESSVRQQLQEAAKARPSSGLRILLTSTASRRLPAELLVGHLTVAVEDVIDFGNGPAIRPDILAARLAGPATPAIDTWLFLSPDGRRLVINGDVTFNFDSAIHIKIIKALVEATKRGERCRAREVLDRAGSSTTTFQQAFGPKLWAQLKPYLISESGRWAILP